MEIRLYSDEVDAGRGLLRNLRQYWILTKNEKQLINQMSPPTDEKYYSKSQRHLRSFIVFIYRFLWHLLNDQVAPF